VDSDAEAVVFGKNLKRGDLASSCNIHRVAMPAWGHGQPKRLVPRSAPARIRSHQVRCVFARNLIPLLPTSYAPSCAMRSENLQLTRRGFFLRAETLCALLRFSAAAFLACCISKSFRSAWSSRFRPESNHHSAERTFLHHAHTGEVIEVDSPAKFPNPGDIRKKSVVCAFNTSGDDSAHQRTTLLSSESCSICQDKRGASKIFEYLSPRASILTIAMRPFVMRSLATISKTA